MISMQIWLTTHWLSAPENFQASSFVWIKSALLRPRGAVTRAQGGKASCLDYFFTTGAEVRELTVGKKFGSSDHMTIHCVVEDFVPVLRLAESFYQRTEQGDTSIVSYPRITFRSSAHSDRWSFLVR